LLLNTELLFLICFYWPNSSPNTVATVLSITGTENRNIEYF